eukprot:2773120-Pyramimonas_sp.AAC.1
MRSPSPTEGGVRARVSVDPTAVSRTADSAALAQAVQEFDRSSPSPGSRPLLAPSVSLVVRPREGPAFVPPERN